MSGFGARDADRDRFVELIEAAHAEGQIGAQDRDLRVAQARTAASRGELEALTRDLQVAAVTPTGAAPEPVGPAPTPPARPRPDGRPPALRRAVRPTGSRPSGSGQARLVVVALFTLFALAAAGVLALVATSFVTGADVIPEVSTPAADAEVGSGPVGQEPVEERAGFELAPADVRTFLRRYEAKFGTSDAFDAVLHPTRVSLAVPVRGSRPRAEQWTYDGAWRRDAAASAVVRPGGIVDLGAIGVRRLFANIATAERTLDVQRGRVTHVAVRHDVAGTPVVSIHVGNTFDESAHLMTTISGDRILRRFPYAP